MVRRYKNSRRYDNPGPETSARPAYPLSHCEGPNPAWQKGIQMNYNPDILKQILQDSPEVAASYLFGSASRNEPVVNDLDLLILLYPHAEIHVAYFELTYRIAQALNTDTDKVDILFFDLKLADPEILYQAVNHGILLKDESPELLTDKIEELSCYFLENEFLIRERKRLERELVEDFCAD